MNVRSKYLFKNMGILTISNFASKILVFLLVPLYTSVLSTSEYGIYDLIISTVTLMFPILSCNIADAVMRFSMDEKYPKKEVVLIGIRFTSISVFIAWFMIFAIRISGIWPGIIGLELFTAIYYFFYAFNHFLIQTAKGYEKVSDMGIAGVLGTVVMITANVIVLLVLRLGLPGFFLANILAQAVPVVYLSWRLRIADHFHHLFCKNTALYKEMLYYCVPLIATTLGWWINSTSDRYVVAFICGVGANGLLSVAYKIPQIINTLQSIFIQAWQISAIKEYGSDDMPSFYGKAFVLMNIWIAGACSLLIFFTKLLGRILYQKQFFEAWQYVPFLLISCVFNSASGFLGPILSAQKDSKSMALSAVFGASANVIMNIVFVILIGIQGATIATAISSFIIYIVRKRAVGSNIKINGYTIVLVTWILLCMQAGLEIYTNYWLVEAAIIVILIIINKRGLSEMCCIGKSLLPKARK